MGQITLHALTEAALERFRTAKKAREKAYKQCSGEGCDCHAPPGKLTPEVFDQLLIAVRLRRPAPWLLVEYLIEDFITMSLRIDELEAAGKMAGAPRTNKPRQ